MLCRGEQNTNMPIALKTNAKKSSTPLIHFWSRCVGAGRANEGLRAGWQEQLKLVHQHCGFRYCRFHGLFHDDMFVYRLNDKGEPIYNFQYVDELFDRMLAIGVRPFVEFGFCPGELATERGTVFWWKGHGSPPNDYVRWGELIDRITRHWVARYGIGEVKHWYFEVWNEPNLDPFFRGTKSQYFELYRTTARAVKSVDPSLRVGGPATSNFVPDRRFAGETEDISQHAVVTKAKDLDALDWQPVWLTEFLQFCEREHLPVDFVSCHPYPTDWALDELKQSVKSTRGVDATRTDLATTRRIVQAGPFPHAEIHLTEWSSSPSSRDFTHDFPQAATFIVKANLESLGLVDSLSYWTFTDVFEEAGGGDAAFHGGFGMINYRGIVKPSFHAYRFLHALGDEILSQAPGVIATRHSASGKITALAYHYPPEVRKTVPASFDAPNVAQQILATGEPTDFALEISNLPPRHAFVVETLDTHHGDVFAAWSAMGRPQSPTPAQSDALSKSAWATHRRIIHADESGLLSFRTSLAPWAVVLLSGL